jgi:hypothetical protein
MEEQSVLATLQCLPFGFLPIMEQQVPFQWAQGLQIALPLDTMETNSTSIYMALRVVESAYNTPTYNQYCIMAGQRAIWYCDFVL